MRLDRAQVGFRGVMMDIIKVDSRYITGHGNVSLMYVSPEKFDQVAKPIADGKNLSHDHNYGERTETHYLLVKDDTDTVAYGLACEVAREPDIECSLCGSEVRYYNDQMQHLSTGEMKERGIPTTRTYGMSLCPDCIAKYPKPTVEQTAEEDANV